MKKIILATVAVLGMTTLWADQKLSAGLNPMVLIELKASMKADLVYANRMISLDIEDDLARQANHLNESKHDFTPLVVMNWRNNKLNHWTASVED